MSVAPRLAALGADKVQPLIGKLEKHGEAVLVSMNWLRLSAFSAAPSSPASRWLAARSIRQPAIPE